MGQYFQTVCVPPGRAQNYKNFLVVLTCISTERQHNTGSLMTAWLSLKCQGPKLRFPGCQCN